MAERERSEGARVGVGLGVCAPLVALALYARTLGFAFVWDDRFLSLLPVYGSGDWRAVVASPGNGLEYLPVRDRSLILDHAIYGADPAGFHATNVVLFALAVALVFVAYR